MRDESSAAFPSAFTVSDGHHATQHVQTGMSLRDYFAAKALLAMAGDSETLVQFRDTYGSDAVAAQIAKASYEMADAMLEARK